MKKILIAFALMSLILLVGCNKRYNPDTNECYGYSDSYATYLKDEGWVINYACPNAETQSECNTNLIKMSAYYKDGMIYRCEYGKWK